eukprot:jgi/Psemu1/287140/fgenesh1_pg.177_\
MHSYETFQYMLAPPSVARSIVDRIVDVTFYDEPRDPSRAEETHKPWLRRQTCTLIKYYLCCLTVAPSHALGASRWEGSSLDSTVSVSCGLNTNTYTNTNTNTYTNTYTNTNTNDDPDPNAPPILRRFRYSYYWGLMAVDTYHVRAPGQDGDGDDDECSFRLVEFLTFTRKPFVFSVVAAFYWIIWAALVRGGGMVMGAVLSVAN